MRRAAVACLLVAACVAASTARADGDPASDYLFGVKVFVPFDVKVPRARQLALMSFVDATNRAGYTIRVAVIGSSYDMGSVISLWRRPRTYARFLGAELQFVYSKRLLIVMPNGFGFFWKGHPVDREYAVLSTIPIAPGAVGLVDAAQTAVAKLATSAGFKVAAPSHASSGNVGRRRLLIVVAALGALALAVLARLALRRRG